MREYDLPTGTHELFEATYRAIARYTGESRLRLGGGAALVARERHRWCSDVELFASPAAYRALFEQRDRFRAEVKRAAGVLEAIEVSRDHCRIELGGGTVSVMTTPPYTRRPRTTDTVRGTSVALDTEAEILAWTIGTRISAGTVPAARDLYDLECFSWRGREQALSTALEVFPAVVRDWIDALTVHRRTPLLPMRRLGGGGGDRTPLDWFASPEAMESHRAPPLPDDAGRGSSLMRGLLHGHAGGVANRPTPAGLSRMFHADEFTDYDRGQLSNILACIYPHDLPLLCSAEGVSIHQLARIADETDKRRPLVIFWLDQFAVPPPHVIERWAELGRPGLETYYRLDALRAPRTGDRVVPPALQGQTQLRERQEPSEAGAGAVRG